MSVNRRSEITQEAKMSHETPMDLDPWELVGEPNVSARDVAWAALALVIVIVGVLFLG